MALLAGDLNAYPDDPLIDPLRQQGLVDEWAALHPDDNGMLFVKGSRWTHPEAELRNRLFYRIAHPQVQNSYTHGHFRLDRPLRRQGAFSRPLIERVQNT